MKRKRESERKERVSPSPGRQAGSRKTPNSLRGIETLEDLRHALLLANLEKTLVLVWY
ncbi:MAG TPA: hypothetical protein VI935_04080 [Thermodesulfobacteriota bacterium]|nr:hypothetical protein [Thermodesulfobacteriota bacterium]